MAIRGVYVKWFDGFFLSVLATNIAIVVINWKLYQSCTCPLHIWTVVDYSVVLTFRLLVFIDNGLASVMGLDFGWPQRCAYFYGRVVVLSILAFLFYPFLWAWTIIGTLWFSNTKICLSGGGKKWSFLIWLIFSYCGLICIACVTGGKWLKRRQSHLLSAPEGIHISEFGILIEMIQVPDWAFEASSQETRSMTQNVAPFNPGRYLNAAQKEAIESSIQELPTFRLTVVPTNCNECLICLEEFCVGNQVRGLPCAHNFHVECIDEWLRLNVSCPRCRCSAFPNLDFSALPDIHFDSQSFDIAMETRDVINQTSS